MRPPSSLLHCTGPFTRSKMTHSGVMCRAASVAIAFKLEERKGKGERDVTGLSVCTDVS